jgi:D-amino-acid dehydrogenase
LPLQAGKGYSVDMDMAGGIGLSRPLLLQEARLAVTPFAGTVRFAGMMEFLGLNTAIDSHRVDAVRSAAKRAVPKLASGPATKVWAGLRPCTPDGMPMVGWLDPSNKVALATGHAMLGLTLAPVTGQLVSDLLAGQTSDDLRVLSPQRFTHRRRPIRGQRGARKRAWRVAEPTR